MVDDNTKKSRSRMWKTGVTKMREREREKSRFLLQIPKKEKGDILLSLRHWVSLKH
jgi:hypothetical protein